MYVYLCTRNPVGMQDVFLLPTKYGNLVFAFKSPDGGLAPYVEMCEELVSDGLALELKVDMTANDADSLAASIRSDVSPDDRFDVVVEGTPEFNRMINELANGQLFSD